MKVSVKLIVVVVGFLGFGCNETKRETTFRSVCTNSVALATDQGVNLSPDSQCKVKTPPKDGVDGQDGAAGENGSNGRSCAVVAEINGAKIVCEDGSEVLITNGTNGQNGQDGADGQNGGDGSNGQDGSNGSDGQDALIEVINPCGVQGSHEELLFRFSDDLVYAIYYDAANSRAFFSRLPAGSYVTTDGFSCLFSVDANNQVSW